MKRYFISGIGTNVGKTIASAVLTEALKADYWKPVQTGAEEDRDLETVRSLISNPGSRFFEEAYSFKTPVSPHHAAVLENTTIDIESIHPPATENTLIIEGAGGLLVPLSADRYVIELSKRFDAPVILVVTDYLGCINHSLLSIDYLKKNGYKLEGLVLNGPFVPETEKAILNYSPVKVIARIPHAEQLNKEFIFQCSETVGL